MFNDQAMAVTRLVQSAREVKTYTMFTNAEPDDSQSHRHSNHLSRTANMATGCGQTGSHMQGDSRRNSDTSLEVQEVGCQHLATWHRDVIPWQGSIVHQRHPYVNITKLRNVLTNKPVFVRNRAYWEILHFCLAPRACLLEHTHTPSTHTHL